MRSTRNPLWDDRVLSMGYNDKNKTKKPCMLCFPTFHRAVDFFLRSIVSICKQRLKGEWGFSPTDQKQLFLGIERSIELILDHTILCLERLK